MTDSQTQVPQTAQDLPPEALAFAHTQFDRARNGDEQLMLYVEAGLPANLTNDAGNTLIMLASYAGHASLVKKLLEKGADPNRPNDRGQTPLAGCAFKGYAEVAKILYEGGADPSLGQPNAIDTANMFKHQAIIDLFKPAQGNGSSTAER